MRGVGRLAAAAAVLAKTRLAASALTLTLLLPGCGIFGDYGILVGVTAAINAQGHVEEVPYFFDFKRGQYRYLDPRTNKIVWSTEQPTPPDTVRANVSWLASLRRQQAEAETGRALIALGQARKRPRGPSKIHRQPLGLYDGMFEPIARRTRSIRIAEPAVCRARRRLPSTHGFCCCRKVSARGNPLSSPILVTRLGFMPTSVAHSRGRSRGAYLPDRTEGDMRGVGRLVTVAAVSAKLALAASALTAASLLQGCGIFLADGGVFTGTTGIVDAQGRVVRAEYYFDLQRRQYYYVDPRTNKRVWRTSIPESVDSVEFLEFRRGAEIRAGRAVIALGQTMSCPGAVPGSDLTKRVTDVVIALSELKNCYSGNGSGGGGGGGGDR